MNRFFDCLGKVEVDKLNRSSELMGGFLQPCSKLGLSSNIIHFELQKLGGGQMQRFSLS